MKTEIWIICAVLAGISTHATAAAKGTETLLSKAEEMSWAISNEAELKALIASKEDAREFMAALFEDETAVSEVADFRFVDLNGDGTLEMVASVDVSGRAFFNNVEVLWKRNKRIHVEEIQANNVLDMNEVIKDVDGDGQMELVVPELAEEYRGAEPVAVVTKIYAIQGAGYTESSHRFKSYYREVVIPELQERLAIAKKAQRTGEVGKLQRELAEINRLLNP